MKTLREWLDERPRGTAAFVARQLDVKTWTIRDLAQGRVPCSRELAERISEVTCGEVDPSTLVRGRAPLGPRPGARRPYRMSIYLSEDERDTLLALAKERGTSPNGILRSFLNPERPDR